MFKQANCYQELYSFGILQVYPKQEAYEERFYLILRFPPSSDVSSKLCHLWRSRRRNSNGLRMVERDRE